MLSSVLSGAAVGLDVPQWTTTREARDAAGGGPIDLGHCFVCVDPERFTPGFEGRLGAYLAARNLPGWSAEAMAFATRLLVALAAEAELRWVVWGLLQQQLATISFEYGDYASQRWGCYRTYVGWASQ